MSYEDNVMFGMKSYFANYKRRYPHKSVEDAIKATRHWAKGLSKAFRGGFIDPVALGKTERELDELRFENP